MTSIRISPILGTILLTITIFSLSLPANAKYSGGMGEPNDPYQITTAEDLMLLGETPEDYDKHFILTADIDLDPNLPGGKVFERAVIAPGWETPFVGVFDGQRHTISHLTIMGDDYLGLFGRLGSVGSGGEVRDLGIADVNITGSGDHVGGLVGYEYASTVSRCYSTGTVAGNDYVGGLVGGKDGTVVACHSSATVGGNDWVGGLMGSSRTGVMSECSSTGAARGNSAVGGLLGGSGMKSTVTDCYSTAMVSGIESIGGLVGGSSGPISMSYSTGAVSGSVSVGGLVGSNVYARIDSSFWDTETSGQIASAGGEGRTTAEMQTAKTFLDAGWDFVGETANGTEDIWKIAEGLGYPRLAWEKYSGGTGEPNDPYQIATAADLIALGETPEDYDKHFILTADIDLDPNLPGRRIFDRAVIAPGKLLVVPVTRSWAYSVYDGAAFSGVFDGNGHRISHLTIKGEDYLGLFGGAIGSDVEIKNLGVVAVNIIGTGDFVGGLAGDGNSTNCYTSGSISGRSYVGGLMGSGSANYSHSTAIVSGDWLVGGLLGSGIAIHCYSTGPVSGESVVGGLVGENRGTISQCYSTGVIYGNNDVGGLVGRNSRSSGYAEENPSEIVNCYSTSNVDGNNYVGGLVGYNIGTLTRCYSTGEVQGSSNIGGLAGSGFSMDVISSFWDTSTSGQTANDGGTGLTDAEIQMASTFLESGWDFVGETANGTEDIWKIAEGLGYPRLAWEKYSGGTGEPNDPYQIATAADLIALGETPEDYDKHFILTADIDLDPNLPGRKVFDRAVIAPDTDPDTLWHWEGTAFTGVFDGSGHTISGLTVEGGGYLGSFGQLESAAEIKNVGVTNVKITGKGSVIGGLLGGNRGRLTQCYSTGTVHGTEDVGGLVGGNSGTTTRCHSTAAVAGAIGWSWGIGGLAGYNSADITQCYSTGAVGGHQSVGGLVGSSAQGSSISDCYSTGSVSGDYDVGGLIGLNGRYSVDYDGPDGFVIRCYSTGPVSGSGPAGHVGGLVGFDSEGVVFDCFWDMQTSGQAESGGGTGKTTADMQDPNTFTAAGWDLVDEIGNGTHEVWQMPAGGGYPVLAVLSGHAPHQLQGSGLRDTPYLIYDALDLGAISRYSPAAHYRLAAPIDLSEIRWSVPVIPCFAGTFDGHGYSISHLRIEGREGLGLFGRLERGGRIVDLGVVDVNITGSSNIGSLVANNSGDLTRCYCSGVVDCNWGRYRALYEWGYVVGGMVGRNDGTVTQCCSTNLVSGLVEVGGLVGANYDGAVSQCYSTGAVIGNSSVGGLAGYNSADITQCYSTGAVGGTEQYSVSGLVGYNYAGSMSMGWSGGTVTACFWDTQTSGQPTSDGGIGKTTADMQTASTFIEADWDFVGETANGMEDIWWIDEGQDYPRLWWENE